MEFKGTIVFGISDDKRIEIDFGNEFLPAKIVEKGELVTSERKALKNRWSYSIKFSNEKDFLIGFEKMLNQLYERREEVNQAIGIYEEVNIHIYLRSDYAQIGYCLPNYLIKKMAVLDCDVCFDILSFGMVNDGELEENRSV